MIRKKHILTAFAALLAFCFLASAAMADQMKLMAVRAAKKDLVRNLTESVVGVKVRSYTESGLTDDPYYKAETKALAAIKGVQVDKMIYDPEKKVALCFGHIQLGDVVTVLKDRISYKNVTVESMGFGSAIGQNKALMALRVAMVNAYDELATVLVGEKISSYTKTENFILTKDSNKSKVLAALYGAYIPNIDLNSPNRGWGWDESGDAFVKLEIDVRKVRDLLGQTIIYTGQSNIIQVTGFGAMEDQMNPQSGDMIQSPKVKIEEGSLNLPGTDAEMKAKDAQ